jgi:hypothetical protein
MYCFTVFSTYVNFGASTVAHKINACVCVTHRIIRLSQVIYANGSRKLFRFRVRYFSGLKYYFT